MASELDDILEIGKTSTPQQSTDHPDVRNGRQSSIVESGKTNEVSVVFTGTALPLFGRSLLFSIASLLVIPAPWAATSFYRWFVEHLSLSDGTRTSFLGKGGDIWYIFILIGLSTYIGFIPVPFLPLLLLPITALLWITVLQWFVRSVSLSCDTPLSFSGTYWQYLGWSLLIGVSVYTIIGWAWATAAMVRWFCRNIQGGNHRVEFLGTGAQILWRTIVTVLACIVIIPIPWITLWLMRWYISNIRIQKA